MRFGKNIAGFSLLEVIIAVGIFAGAMTAILTLLPSLARSAADAGDAQAALRLADAIQVELQRVAQAGGFDPLAAQIPVMALPLPEGFSLVASRDGARVHSRAYHPPAAGERVPEPEQYFLIEAWRFAQAPLSYDAAAPWLALQVRITWPYRNPGAAGLPPTALADREQATCTVGIRR